MQRKVHAVQKRVLGLEHSGTLVIAGNLALSLYDQGMYTEAEQVQREVLEALTHLLEAEHAGTLRIASNLAASLSAQGTYEEADQMQREVHQAQKRVLRREHRDTLTIAGNLAIIALFTDKERMRRQSRCSARCMRRRRGCSGQSIATR